MQYRIENNSRKFEKVESNQDITKYNSNLNKKYTKSEKDSFTL